MSRWHLHGDERRGYDDRRREQERHAKQPERDFSVESVRMSGSAVIAKLAIVRESDLDGTLRYLRTGAKLWATHYSVSDGRARVLSVRMGLYDESAREVTLERYDSSPAGALLDTPALISVMSDVVQSLT